MVLHLKRTCLLCFLLLGVVPVWNAQGSTLLIFLLRDEVYIAADSLSIRFEGGPSRTVCKIRQVGTKMFFAAVGTGVLEDPPFDPFLLAQEVAASHMAPAEAAKEYARRALAPLQTVWNISRKRYLELGMTRGPQDYLFVGVNPKGALVAAGASFAESDSVPGVLQPVEYFEYKSGDEEAHFGKYGVRSDIPGGEEFLVLSQQIGRERALKRFVEAQIKATPQLVGPPVVVLVLRKDGSFDWISPGVCDRVPVSK